MYALVKLVLQFTVVGYFSHPDDIGGKVAGFVPADSLGKEILFITPLFLVYVVSVMRRKGSVKENRRACRLMRGSEEP
jgi:hypothetical protein